MDSFCFLVLLSLGIGGGLRDIFVWSYKEIFAHYILIVFLYQRHMQNGDQPVKVRFCTA